MHQLTPSLSLAVLVKCELKLESIKRRERFVYKLAAYYPNSGEFKYEKIENGKDVDITQNMSSDILDVNITNWYNSEFSLFAEFDNKQYPGVRNSLREYVMGVLPENQLHRTTDEWDYDEGHPDEGDRGVVVWIFQWCVNSLNEIEQFLNEINKILEPVLDVAKLDSEGNWENKKEFAYAAIRCNKTGFHIVGTLY